MPTPNDSITLTNLKMTTNASRYKYAQMGRDEDEYADAPNSDFEHAFVSKFANNNVDTNTIMKMSTREDAVAIMNLPSSKIWIVLMVAMPIEQFYAMRFMCTSLKEFVELVTLGSVNELRQVYSTLNARMDRHMDTITCGHDIAYMNTFADSHPSKFMITGDNPEMDVMMEMMQVMRSRMTAYMNFVTTTRPSMDADTWVGTNNSELSFSRQFWIENVVRQGIPAKTWQPSRATHA